MPNLQAIIKALSGQNANPMMTDFTYGLGNALAAASENPRSGKQRTYAGIAAALQGPKQMQVMAEQKAIAEQDRQQKLLQALTQQSDTASNIQRRADQTKNEQDTLGETRRLRDIEAERLRQQQVATDAAAKQEKYLHTIETDEGQFDVFSPPGGAGDPIVRKVGGGKPKAAPAPDRTITPFEAWQKQNPDAPVAEWLKISEKPPSAAAESTSYKYHNDKLVQAAKPVDEAAARTARLIDTVDQETAIADAEVAPELISIIAGGMGSGIRITNSEINAVYGGRPVVEQIKSKIRQWTGTDQKSAIKWGPEERKAIHDLVGVVQSKITAKQSALSEFGDLNSRQAVTEQQRRDGLAALNRKLREIDQGMKADTANGKAPKVGDIVPINGKRVKITAIHSDGTFDGTEVK